MDKTKVIRKSFPKQSIIFVLIAYIFSITGHENETELIYILLWSYRPQEQWAYRNLEMGQEAFTSRNCTFQNCFITANHSYLNNILDYDVLMFNAVHYAHFYLEEFPFPTNRSKVQLYILFCVEPAAYNHLPKYMNEIFNLTWTYKLNSDIVHPYILIKNKVDEIIGPKVNMSWIDINDMPPVNKSIIQKLENKRLAAVWVASDCFSKDRLVYILKLENELRSKHELQLDIFGKCGNESVCPMNYDERVGLLSNCYKKIQSDYYFYLAFENSKSEDYVSEKVLHGLLHYTVPVVYGGADYNRFLPNGTYLDASKLGVEELANEMHDIIRDSARYYDFFKWHGYYTFQDTAADKYSYTVCELCAFLNNNKRKRSKTVRTYDNITHWWNVPVPEYFAEIDSFRSYVL